MPSGCERSSSLLNTVCKCVVFSGHYPPFPGVPRKQIRHSGSDTVRAVIQRVTAAQVTVSETVVAKTGPGLCVLLAVHKDDREGNADFLGDKIANLRIFEDAQGKMNLSVRDSGGELLIVSQFTLYGDCRKGNRPFYSEAAPAPQAEILYDRFVQRLRLTGLRVATGRFQARMAVSLVNDGPVTILLEG